MSSTEKTSNLSLPTSFIDSSVVDRHVPPGCRRLLIAFSGGPDSTALLSLLSELRQRRPLSLYAAYIDHALRPQDEREEELRSVTSTAAELHIPLICIFLPPGRVRAEARSGGEEAAARRLRYAALRSTAGRLECDAVCTAHTKTDQAETILMRVFQGSGPEGLAGMHEREGRIVRPLLRIERAEVMRYLRMRGLGFSEDSSNRSTRYLRNALRQRLAPLLAELFPGYEEGLLTLAEKSEKVQQTLDQYVPLPPVRSREEGTYVEAQRFDDLSPWGREKTIYLLFNALRADAFGSAAEYRLPYRFVRDAAERAVQMQEGVVARGHGIVLQRNRTVFECRVKRSPVPGNAYVVRIRSGRFTLWERVECSFEFCAPDASGAQIPYYRAREPYVLRSPREGDTLTMPGGHHKTVKALLYDMGIPAHERDLVPLVQDRTGIAALCAGPWGGPAVLNSITEAEEERYDGRIRIRFHHTGDST